MRAAADELGVDGIAADVATAEGAADGLRGAAATSTSSSTTSGSSRRRRCSRSTTTPGSASGTSTSCRRSGSPAATCPGMRDRGWGRVQFMASDSAVVIPLEMVHYGVTKTALLGVARGFAKAMKGTGVTVNSVIAGPTHTEGVEEFVRELVGYELAVGRRAAPVRRRAPAELAARPADRAGRDRQPRRLPELGPRVGHHRRRDPGRRRLRRPHPAVIAVTGATGRGRPARRSRGSTRRALIVRDASRAPAGYDVRVASDYGAVRRDARGAGGRLDAVPDPGGRVAPTASSATRPPSTPRSRRACRGSSTSRSSARRADHTFTLGRDHWWTEEHIRACGVPWTFLRMSLYLDFIPNMVGEDGAIRGPAGDGRLAAILRDDVAAAAAAVLTGDGHDRAHLRPHGPGDVLAGRGGRGCWAPRTSTRPTRRRTRHAPRTARPTGRSRVGSRPTRRSATGPWTS